MDTRLKVAVLAATGAVGQRFVSLLVDHPWFEVAVLTASERSAGKIYREAVHWMMPDSLPDEAGELTVQLTSPDTLQDVDLVFSALPSGAAREIEPMLARAGYNVCSNASAFRMDPAVPLLIPEINASHIDLIPYQRAEYGWSGMIVTSPNCAATSLIFPLKALADAFGVAQAHAVTMQAISGAGYPGVASLDIVDNIIPYIKGEEEKIETETLKMLGDIQGDSIQPYPAAVSAQVHRVPVIDGHLVALSIGLERKASIEEVQRVLRDFTPPAAARDLPSAPPRTIILREEIDRPQPRLDRDAEEGMATTVGRVQACPVLDVKLISLAHNTLRGAAGGTILNAELLVSAGYVGQGVLEKASA